MKAMILAETAPLHPGSNPLQPAELPAPEPGPGEILIKVSACGVCHTELDEIEGREGFTVEVAPPSQGKPFHRAGLAPASSKIMGHPPLSREQAPDDVSISLDSCIRRNNTGV